MLGIPTAGSPAAPFAESLARLVLPPGIDALERTIVTGNYIPAERDILLERAIAWNADVMVMCDDDMVLPPNALGLLLDALERDPSAAIAGALYYSRDGLRPMTVDGWNPEDVSGGWIPAFGESEPVSVEGVGFGCVAIRIDAVKAFARPFFSAHVFVEPAEGRVRICNEDYLFCRRVREAGSRVLLHPGLRCGHFDRASGRTAPAFSEPASITNMKRVLTRTGDRYHLAPLEGAPESAATERHVRADLVYVVSGETP
jgi:GT2 family glycosyltransferase